MRSLLQSHLELRDMHKSPTRAIAGLIMSDILHGFITATIVSAVLIAFFLIAALALGVVGL